MLSPARRLLKLIHLEAMPWPATLLYNALSRSSIFQKNYDLVVQDILEHCPGKRILDIGTGPGWLLVKLHRRAPELQLTGVDVSAPMVAMARKNIDASSLKDRIRIETGSASLLPFHSNSFDAVVSTGSIHHWKDPKTALNEVYRVLRKGGVAHLYDLVSDTPRDVLEGAAADFGRLRAVLLRVHAFEEPFYSMDALVSLAEGLPFVGKSTRFVGIQFCLSLTK
jgi:ubiquinone/menaquinone biosynthesis C-methylase UbiE